MSKMSSQTREGALQNMLQEHDGALRFATDAWTSPNHKVFIAVTVHFENNGMPICMILDIVEVAMSHSGVNLAAAFVDILQEFGVSDKVSFNERTLEKILTCILQILCIMCNNASVRVCPIQHPPIGRPKSITRA